jgi:hypothetical protein
MITLIDVQQVLRQILRYHCRLNHLSAHTAMLSIKFMDLFADPIGMTQQIRAFLYPSSLLSIVSSEQHPLSKRGNDGKNEESETDDDQSAAAGEGMAIEEEKSIDDDQSSLMDSELAYGSQILTAIQKMYIDRGRSNVTIGRTVLDVLDATLVDEFYITKDMSKWPCLSFWDPTPTLTLNSDRANIDSPSSNQSPPPSTTMSDIVQRLARKLSPDCDDPYNTCFVRRDTCEFRGDAECATTTTTETR